LSDETGGRSYLNANALDEGIDEALHQNSAYYLMGWRPEGDTQRQGRSQIQVTVKDRPDLRVRTRRHYFDPGTLQSTKSVRAPAASSEDDLKLALGSLYPRRDVPTSVAAIVDHTLRNGPVLNVSMKIDSRLLTFESTGGKDFAVVDVLGAAIDDRGVCSTFRQKLDIPREALAADPFVKWTQALRLPPGLYQVRVAVRDRQSGRTGSAMLWVEITRLELTPAGMP
jgi:hypothetical protein